MLATLAVGVSPAEAIEGGTLDGNQHPNVGVVVITVGSDESLCSGSLVPSSSYGEVFLTAAHCAAPATQASAQVTFDPAPLIPGFDDGSPGLNPNPVWYTGRSFADPDFIGTSATAAAILGPTTNPQDLGVVVFDLSDMPTGIAPLPIAPVGTDVALGARVTRVGYGLSSPSGFVAGIRRRVSLDSIINKSPAELEVASNFAAGTCPGDSGGPAIVSIGGVPTEIGTVSRGFAGACNDTIYERVDTSEVQAFVNAAEPGMPTLPNGQPTAYVTGANASRDYGVPNPAFTYTASSIPVGISSGQPVLSTPADVSSDAGTYPINVTAGTFTMTGSFEPYTVNFTPGTLTIYRSPLTITGRTAHIVPGRLTSGVAFTAVLRNAAAGAGNAPASGVPVTFAAADAGGNVYSCNATSSGAGVASCTTSVPTALLGNLNRTYTVTAAQSTDYLLGAGTFKLATP